MENQREIPSALVNIIKNMIIPGRRSKEFIKYERTHPNKKKLSSREEVLLHSSSYIIPTIVWSFAIYKVYESLN